MGIIFKDNLDQYIRSIKLSITDKKQGYPFNLPAVKALKTLELDSRVSFIIGENGSGKSTILEAIAVAYGFNPEGGSKNYNFSTNDSHSILSEYITISKGVKIAKDGFFLRAESFYNVATNVDELAKQPGGFLIGGKSLHHQSHGESFISLIMNRFSPNGLYILDEPEAALSPTRQMAFISRMHELVNNNCQFIIATHSPILMSYPNSTIYNIESGYEPIKLEDTEHYLVTKKFMNNKKMMLDILLKD